MGEKESHLQSTYRMPAPLLDPFYVCVPPILPEKTESEEHNLHFGDGVSEPLSSLSKSLG